MKLIREQIDALKERQVKYQENHNKGDLKEVMQGYEALMNQCPEDPEILFQYATAHLQLGNHGTAAQLFKRAAAYLPDNPHTWSNMGCCYRSMHMLKEARDCFSKSLMFGELAETYSNYSACFVNEDCPEDGVKFAVKAMELNPDDARARWNYSLLQLEQGNYKEGFKFYDAGLISGERAMRSYANPETTKWWDGSLLNSDGKPATVVMWDEQGLGDRILFSNLLRSLPRSVNYVLECHPRLEGLYRRSFPWMENIHATVKQEHIDWPHKYKIDYKIPIPSLVNLGHWFDRTPYLIPDPEKVEKYREAIQKLGPPPYYGFSWYGGAPKTNNIYRSMKLRDLKPLMERYPGTWISLQYHDWAAGKVERFRQETGLNVFHLDEAVLADDYDESVALAAATSHVVTVCTSMVHVCGAAGIPCTVLVPRKRAWRYPKGDHFPWYGEHIRQIHQVGEEPWSEMLKRVAL